MDPKEIRIGNWFHHNVSMWSYRNDDGVISNYGKFNSDCFQWNEYDWYAIGECTLVFEAIEPIQLTEEWLIKFGFRKINSTWLKLGIFAINISLDVEWGNNWIGVRLQYVHQLQNLYFALTGEELELNQ